MHLTQKAHLTFPHLSSTSSIRILPVWGFLTIPWLHLSMVLLDLHLCPLHHSTTTLQHQLFKTFLSYSFVFSKNDSSLILLWDWLCRWHTFQTQKCVSTFLSQVPCVSSQISWKTCSVTIYPPGTRKAHFDCTLQLPVTLILAAQRGNSELASTSLGLRASPSIYCNLFSNTVLEMGIHPFSSSF